MSDRQQIEDALKSLYDLTEGGVPAANGVFALAVGLPEDQASALVESMREAGLVAVENDGIVLRPEGLEYALQVVRAHRLYETFLAHRTGLRPSAWHTRAHAVEHVLSPAEVERLAAALGNPRYDPHGDPIPTAAGDMPGERGKPLVGQHPGWAGRILHVEDEPPDLYRILSRAGCAPDVRLRVEAAGPTQMTVRIDGRLTELSLAAAEQLTVDDLPSGEEFDETIVCLSSLRPGQKAEVVGISPLIRGLARSRLLDLGVVPGSVLDIQLTGPAGDPIAYTVRGATIALRREQSDRILIRVRQEGSG